VVRLRAEGRCRLDADLYRPAGRELPLRHDLHLYVEPTFTLAADDPKANRAENWLSSASRCENLPARVPESLTR